MPGLVARVAGAIRGATRGVLGALGVMYRPILSSTTGRRDTILNMVRMRLPGPLGTSDRYREKWKSIDAEDARGCKISDGSFSSGKFGLQVPDHMVSRRALQKFMAHCMSDTEGVLEHKRGVMESLTRPESTMRDGILSKVAEKQCAALLALRAHLRKNGCDVIAECSPPGSNNVIARVTIDVTGKSAQEVEKLVADAFSAFGIRNPKLAKSVAENLIKDSKDGRRGQEEHTSSTELRDFAAGRDESRATTPPSVDGGPGDSGRGVSSSSQDREEPGLVQPEDFSLTSSQCARSAVSGARGGAGAPELQAGFLAQGNGTGRAGTRQGQCSEESFEGVLKDSAAGLTGVKGGELGKSGGGVGTPTPVPGVKQPNPGRSVVE